jgi:hypothetical protein
MLKVIVSLATVMLLTCCASITSKLTVPPGEKFVLGGNPNDGFRVEGTNRGTVAVELFETFSTGEERTLGVVAAGASFVGRFAAGSSAAFVNLGSSPAELKARITGDTELNMGYEAASTD